MLISKKGSVSRVRYVIKFTKESDIKFISHLDLMRTIQRVIRRAQLPIEYSQGFNPHMSLSIAQPLSVGIYSEGEYMDIVLTEEIDEKEIMDRFNKNAPLGIKIRNVIQVQSKLNEKKIPQIMALLDAASYQITIKYNETSNLLQDINSIMSMEQWNIVKRSKSGEKEVNIKPLVKEFKYEISGDNIKINAQIACGSRENLSPELLSDFIKAHSRFAKDEAFVDILRKDMYALIGDKLVPVYKYFS